MMGSQAVKVSVVIPCYNLGRFLDEAVESVLHQTYEDFEIIIVNDGSTDEYTNNLLNFYNKPKTRVITINNQGPSIARNTGIEESRGEYILPVDADDKIEPTYLEKAVKILDDEPGIGFVYSSFRLFGEKDEVCERDQFDIRALLISNCVCGCALFRKKAWEEVGGYNRTEPHGYEDWDFWLKIVEKGWKGYRIPEYLFQYRWRHDSLSKRCMLPENYTKIVNEMCLSHKELYQRYVDYLVSYNRRWILDREKLISDQEKKTAEFA